MLRLKEDKLEIVSNSHLLTRQLADVMKATHSVWTMQAHSLETAAQASPHLHSKPRLNFHFEWNKLN